MIEDIKNTIDSDLTELLKKLIQREEEKYYQYYIGKVVSNKDPEKLGRCQIMVYGLFDSLPEKDLPWAIPDFTFVGSQVGSFIVPPEGAMVNVRFSNGNIYEPIYCSKVLVKTKLPKNKDKNYPNNLIFYETDNGDYFQINTETLETEFKSSQGVLFKIDRLGNVTLDTTAIKTPMQGSITINANGPVKVIAPIVEVPHKARGTVIPNPTGGPFNALPFDPITGAVHQGTQLTNV